MLRGFLVFGLDIFSDVLFGFTQCGMDIKRKKNVTNDEMFANSQRK